MAGAAAIDKGVVLQGLLEGDFEGLARDPLPDVGAYEYRKDGTTRVEAMRSAAAAARGILAPRWGAAALRKLFPAPGGSREADGRAAPAAP
jgi:hypothetical protein